MRNSVEKGGSWSTIRHLCLQGCCEPHDLIPAFWLAATVYRQNFAEIQFPAKQSHGGSSFVSTISTLFYPVDEYNACRQRCQLINKASQHRLDSHFAPFTGYPRNYLWSSEAALWCVHGFPTWVALFALLCRVRASNLNFVYCRLEYIKLGSPQDSTWRDFPQALAEMQGARRYITLFEAPFVASKLEGCESQALRASSLMAIPPPPPGFQPLPGAPLVDLAGQNLVQWADCVQEVASHMRLPPHVAVECPASDMIEVLNRLEDMTRVRYCRHCFGVGRQCRCSVMPHQAPGTTTSLWSPPGMSYAAMASSTETIASTSIALRAVGTSSMPQLEAMETSPPLSMANLLLTAGAGRGVGGWTPPWAPTTPGPHQSRLRAPPPQMPTPGGQGAAASTPYKQQVTPPSTPAPGQSAVPRASQSQSWERPAGEETRPQGRSASRGPCGRQRASRSSTRGSSLWRSRKCHWVAPDDDVKDEMSNYVASGWRRDLVHFIGCCWASQVGSLQEEGWQAAITKFLAVMTQRKKEWVDLKELTPLWYMPYMAHLFHEVTWKDLRGLNRFTGWIGWGGYYHWRLVQQGLIHHVPRLQDDPIPKVPKSHPSGQPLPARPPLAGTQAPGAATGPPGQPTSQGGGSRPASGQGSAAPTTSRCRRLSIPSQSATPATSGGPTDQLSGGAGAGDGSNWYQTAIREAGGKISESQGPPFPVALAQVRQKSVGHMVGRQPPDSNIFSRGLRAYYTRVDLLTLDTWACQTLCMIAEYHLACVTWGSAATGPILPGELEEHLPPLTSYFPPEDRTGATDVRVRDNWAQTLCMAVWCHHLDMAVNDPNSSRSLIKACHQMGVLSAYFLGPGTAWRLTFKDVVTRVLQETVSSLMPIEMRQPPPCIAVTRGGPHCIGRLRQRPWPKSWRLTPLRAGNWLSSWLLFGPPSEPWRRPWRHMKPPLRSVECKRRRPARQRPPVRSLRRNSSMKKWQRMMTEMIRNPLVLMQRLTRRIPLLPWRRRTLFLQNLGVMSSLPRRTPSSCSQRCYLEVPPPDLTAPGVRPVQSRGSWLSWALPHQARPNPWETRLPSEAPFCGVSKPSVRGSFVSLGRLRYSNGVLCHFVRIEWEERSWMKNGRDGPKERGMRWRPSLFQ